MRMVHVLQKCETAVHLEVCLQRMRMVHVLQKCETAVHLQRMRMVRVVRKYETAGSSSSENENG